MPKGIYLRKPNSGVGHYERTPEIRKKVGNSSLGHTTSEEAKLKMSLAHKGQKTWNKGLTKLDNPKLGNVGMPRNKYRGEKNFRWKGGTSRPGKLRYTLTEYNDWRKKIFERDNYTCKECGARNYIGNGKTVILNGHHIKSFTYYPESRFDLNNGITLCLDCHKKTDNFGAAGVNNVNKN
mgnify:CR=1 FL=1